MDWPEVTELRDITITPLLGPSSKGSLALAADPPSPALQHFRYGSQESALKIQPLDTDSTPPAIVVEDPIIYGGLLFRHFGHALTESIHRLWPRYALKELHRAKVAFNLVNNTKIMPYVTEALNLHGLSKSDVFPITEPVLFKRLFVGQQARTLAGPTTIPRYRTMLDRDHSRRLPPPAGERRLYVSRLHHHHTGSYYGESFVEHALVEEGFDVVHPENHSLTDFVIMLRNSRMAVFAEGSAIHALELCGSHVPEVAVISRRPVSMQRFSPLLFDICDRWMISEQLRTTAGMALDVKKHSGLLELPAVMRDLRDFADLSSDFDQRRAEMVRAVEDDVERHIADPRNERTDDYEARADELRRTARKMVSLEGRRAA